MQEQQAVSAVISQVQLDQILVLHKKYRMGSPGGKRCVLQFKVLDGLDFKKADMSGSDFAGSSFVGANLMFCNFDHSNFYACDMRKSNLSGASFKRADFRGAYIANANIHEADFSSVDLREGRLMKGSNMSRLEAQKHPGAEEDIIKTSFEGSSMKNSNFTGVKALSADFTGADMSGVSLTDADLRKANFKEANLTKADLTGSDLRSANMERTNLSGAKLQWVETDDKTNFKSAKRAEDVHNDLYDGERPLIDKIADHIAYVNSAGVIGIRMDVKKRDFREITTLRRYPLTSIQATDCNFSSMDLNQIQLQSSLMHENDFSDCNFSSADLRGSSFKGSNMRGVNLSLANLKPLFFAGKGSDKKLLVNMQNVDLTSANLYGADLSLANFRGAILRGADLSGSNLSQTDFRGANLDGTKLENCNIADAIRE